MAIPFYSDIDLNNNKIKNFTVDTLDQAPTNPNKGQQYYNTTDNKLYYWNGTEWVTGSDEYMSVGDTLPIGSTLEWFSTTIPDNWLVCDGSAVSRTTYSDLFAVIGTTFGEGDGSTTFNLPNLKGRTIVGLDADDADFNTIGKTIGEKTHTLTVAEMPEHNHKMPIDSFVNSDSQTNVKSGGHVSYKAQGENYETTSAGGSQPHNNIQPSFIGVYIIKAKQSAGVVATVVDNLESTSETDALSAKQGKVLNEKIETLTSEEKATGDTLPIGSIMPYPKATAPENWLICDGSAISRTDYSELFNAIGTTFGEGDGSTTFNLPNIKGRTIVGLDTDDTDFNAIGKTPGEKTHTLTVEEMPKHSHTLATPQYYYGESNTGSIYGSNTATSQFTRNTNTSGNNQPHNNIQPSFVATYIIKAKQSAGLVATVVDNLTSTSSTNALSANQGKTLNEKIDKSTTYSTNEQAIGTWIDGKTIYRKVIDFGTLPNNERKTVDHNISSIDKFIKVEGIATRSDDTKFSQSLPLVYMNLESNYNTTLGVDTTSVEIRSTEDRSMFKAYVTIEYTKTTN